MRSCPALLFVLLLGMSAHAADLRGLANDFIDAHDKQASSRKEVPTDRDSMKTNLDDSDKLRSSVQEFFNDRADIEKFSTEKANVRDMMLKKNTTPLGLLMKAPKSTKNLQADTQNFVNAFDTYRAKSAEMEQDIEGIRQALLQSDDGVLHTAVGVYFVTRRERHSARNLWTAALKAMKKDVLFRSTLKVTKFDADSLKGYTQEFLSDRDTWVALGVDVETDYNALRGAVSGASPDLPTLVTKFFTDKKARTVKAQEMAKDRSSMVKNNPLKSIKSIFKSLFASASENAKIDEEEEQLEQSVDHAGV